MLQLVKAGRCTLYNGTYSQPHLQTLSSEANYRQFEYGQNVYRELGNFQIVTYAHQECSFNEQTPQLLNAFGIQYMPIPQFIGTIVMEGGELLFHYREGTMFVQGSEFTHWRGLDGTLIYVYLQEHMHMKVKDWINYQEVKGLLQVPPILVEIPDMNAVDDQWMADRQKGDFVLLDEALAERLRKYPPRFQSRMYTNWSYIEGIRAEELSRCNFIAEQSVLRAEAVQAIGSILLDREFPSTSPVWKTILATQHHDVYCFCGPEIREKCIGRLNEAAAIAWQMTETAAREILAQIRPLQETGLQIVVFNTNPHPIVAPVTVELPLQTPALFNSEGQPVACQVTSTGESSSTVTFLDNQTSFGYSSYSVREGGVEDNFITNLDGEFHFRNHYYDCQVDLSGSFTSLKLVPGGDELLSSVNMHGNQLAGQDSTGLGSRHAGIININVNPDQVIRWEPPGPGPELHFEPDGRATVLETPVCSQFQVHGNLNERVKAELSIFFYKELPRIDFEWVFLFDRASVGSFYHDDSKLRVQWPLSFKGKITHDISFGVVTSFEERPFLPASWVDITDGEKGFAYFHQGTIKHWVEDGMLVNLFAWGEDTDAIGNRLGMGRWPKTFDQRLNGKQTIRYSIYPHQGDWRSADVIGVARSYDNPPIPFVKPDSAGLLPPQIELIQITNPLLVSTVVNAEGPDILCRLYSVSQDDEPVVVKTNGLDIQGIYTLSGERISSLSPYKIGKILLKPVSGAGE